MYISGFPAQLAAFPARSTPKTFVPSAEIIMGLFSKDIATFQDLYIHQIEDIYYAEQQITKALPKMIAKATDVQLRQGFEQHLRETEGQIERLRASLHSKACSPRA
jgi:hypothetical protein